MDIPRLDAKGVAVELVNDAIKHAFLTLGYDAATTDQDKAKGVPTGQGCSRFLTNRRRQIPVFRHLTSCV